MLSDHSSYRHFLGLCTIQPINTQFICTSPKFYIALLDPPKGASGVQTVYLNPLHISPFSLRASATLLYRPLRTSADLFSKPSINSSRSPRSRALFSRLRRMVYVSELSQPMAMYMSTIPWPRLYHGLSCSRYYVAAAGGRLICCAVFESQSIEHTTLDVTAPFRFPNEMAMASAAPRLYEPSTLLETQADMFGIKGNNEAAAK